MLHVITESAFDGERFTARPLLFRIEGERIASVQPFAGEIPSAGTVLDARGATLLPGLINTHVHIARGGMFEPDEGTSVRQIARNLETTLGSGVTTIADLGCTAPLIRALRDCTARAPAAGPAIVAAGPVLTAPGGYPLDYLSGIVAKLVVKTCGSEVEGCQAVEQIARSGMDHVKLMVMHQSYTEKPMPAVTLPVARAIVGEAQRLGLRVLAHAHSVADYRVALEAGVHGLMHSALDPLDAETIARVAASGAAVCPTLWSFESVCLGAERRWDRDASYAPSVIPAVRRSWSRFAEAYQSSGDVIPPITHAGLRKARVREAIRVAAANLKLLADAGVPIVFGTDAAYGFAVHERPTDELLAMNRAGLGIEACLRAATSDAAALLELPDRGALAPGKRADLILVNANVTRDLRSLEDIRAVVVAGQVVGARTPWLRSARTAAAALGGVVRTYAAGAKALLSR